MDSRVQKPNTLLLLKQGTSGQKNGILSANLELTNKLVVCVVFFFLVKTNRVVGLNQTLYNVLNC